MKDPSVREGVNQGGRIAPNKNYKTHNGSNVRREPGAVNSCYVCLWCTKICYRLDKYKPNKLSYN